MTLTAGTRLGPYEVIAQIGMGGMGEVYRATDTNLWAPGRDRGLAEAFAQDADRLARYSIREASTIASLESRTSTRSTALSKISRLALIMSLAMRLRFREGLVRRDGALAKFWIHSVFTSSGSTFTEVYA